MVKYKNSCEIQEFIEKFEKKSNHALSGAYLRKFSNNFKKNTDESTYDFKEDENIQEMSQLMILKRMRIFRIRVIYLYLEEVKKTLKISFRIQLLRKT